MSSANEAQTGGGAPAADGAGAEAVGTGDGGRSSAGPRPAPSAQAEALAAAGGLNARAWGGDYSGAALDRLNKITYELTNIFGDAGFSPIEPAILQPADLLFQLYGEEIWARAFIVDDADHGALCLRPDFTAPVARAHLARLHAEGAPFDQPARYGYFGPVFRRALTLGRGGVSQPVQQLQAGVEIIGEDDPVARDAEVFEICLKALTWAGCGDYDIVTGDLAVIFSLLDAAVPSETRRRRLIRRFWRPELFQEALRRYGAETAPEAEAAEALLRGLSNLDERAAEAAVLEMIRLSDIPQIGARSAREVAERLRAQALDAADPPLAGEVIALIEAALAVSGPAPQALATLRDLAQGGALDLGAALDRLARRFDAVAALGVDLERLRFDAAFGRNLAYYDGFVFEMRKTMADGAMVKLGGGGRYDRMFAALGGGARISGVGAALRPEAMLQAGADLRSAAGRAGGAR